MLWRPNCISLDLHISRRRNERRKNRVDNSWSRSHIWGVLQKLWSCDWKLYEIIWTSYLRDFSENKGSISDEKTIKIDFLLVEGCLVVFFSMFIPSLPPLLRGVFLRRSPCYAIPSTVGKIPWRRFRIFVTSTSPCILWKRVSKNLWLTSFERCWRWWFFGQIMDFSLFLFFLFFFWWLALSEKFCFKHLVSWFVKNVTPFFGWEICVFFVFFWMFQGLIVKLAPFF